MTHILYNPFSGNGEGKVRAEEVKKFYEGKETEFVDMTSVDYGAFFAGLPEGDDICICGGDGTLNRFVNDTDGIEKKCDIFYFATGTGSDFWHELGYKPGDAPIKVNEYLADLPIVEIAGKRMRVLNGVGYGIDGYCCEVADVIREKDPGSKINYAGIAIKGLLFHFKPVRATVTVDGVEHVIEARDREDVDRSDDEREMLRRRHDADPRAGPSGPEQKAHDHADARQGQDRNADHLPEDLQGRARQAHGLRHFVHRARYHGEVRPPRSRSGRRRDRSQRHGISYHEVKPAC